jgi:hypothetical protein
VKGPTVPTLDAVPTDNSRLVSTCSSAIPQHFVCGSSGGKIHFLLTWLYALDH